MPADIEFKAIGLDELIKRAAALNGHMGPIVREFLTKSVQHVEKDAKRFAPVDTGRLRASITHKVSSTHIPDWASAGTNLIYAKPMEYGTKPGHFPPWGKKNPGLELWAKRHGISNGFLVARAISRQGLRPRAYMSKAWEETEGIVDDNLEQAKQKIESMWK